MGRFFVRTSEKLYMSTSIQADSLFQVIFKAFSHAFGIVDPKELQTQQREILPEFVQMDAMIVFPDEFDFTTLNDKSFPFLGQKTAIEYKGQNDALSVMRFYQYSFTELGIITTHLLSKERKDRKERESLSQRGAKEQWESLKAQGAKHSCCMVILSTTDPTQLRKEVGFEAVHDYPHLDGALYRLIVSENKFVGSIASYLVVLNHLPIHPKNAPLLLLSKGKKQSEFCRWLIEQGEGITLEENLLYQFYLLKYNLIQSQEVKQKMRHKLLLSPTDYEWFIDQFVDLPEEARLRFARHVNKRFLHADSPIEVAQKVLQADSPLEMAQKVLQADSPEEAALHFIQSEEQVNRLLELIQQRNLKKADS